jgi:serine/threonine protein kinase
MAEVYVARQTGMAGFERQVVIKRVRSDLLGDYEAVASLLDEARLVATLQHPNIAQIHEIGRVNDSYFIAMEYLPGADLRELMQRAATASYRIPAADAIYIAIQICVALHYAHEKRSADGVPLGIIHRDVTPSNVLVSYDGAIKICDFGIAKATSRSNQTVTGTLKGKYGYMSPEQCQCLPLDRRSDIFSLGILLYELSTLTRAFTADSEFELLRMIVEGPPPPPSTRIAGYPRGLEQIVMRALAPAPADRYATMQDMQLELEALAREQRFSLSSVNIARLMTELFGDARASAPAGLAAPIGLADLADPPDPAGPPARGSASSVRLDPAHGSAALNETISPASSDPASRATSVGPGGLTGGKANSVRRSSQRRVALGSGPQPEIVSTSAPQPPSALASTRVPRTTLAVAGLSIAALPMTEAPAGPPRPQRPSVLWLFSAVVAWMIAIGVSLTGRALDLRTESLLLARLETSAERIATALEVSHRMARVRAAGIATMPILRAAIETDAATMRDIAERDSVFAIGNNEELEVFQIRGGEAMSLLRLPATGPPIAPLMRGTTRIASAGDTITVVAAAPVVGANVAPDEPGPAGQVAVATRVDLAAAPQGLAQYAAAAWLRGPGLDVRLVGTARDSAGDPALSQVVPLPATAELNVRGLALIAVPLVSPHDWAWPIQLASLALGALILAGYIWRRLRMRSLSEPAR